MRFGFSYVGFIYLVMLLVPNLIWAKNKPEDYALYAKNENRILLILERAGEILVSAIVLVCSDFNLRAWTPWCLWLVASFFLMILYELYWYRYFGSGRTMRDQYRSFCGFPVAGATLPVTAFFLLGIYGLNVWLILAVVILGIGHIGIHLRHEKEACGRTSEKTARIICRALSALLACLFLFVLGTFVFHRVKTNRELAFLKEKGYYNPVPVGTYSLNVAKFGNENGGHTIISLAGLGMGDYSVAERRMTAQLEIENLVVFVNRAGYGLSDDTDHEMTLDYIVEDYRRALKNAGIESPYVLMAHSIGGAYATWWESLYPGEIEAVVLIEGSELAENAFEDRTYSPVGFSDRALAFLAKLGFSRYVLREEQYLYPDDYTEEEQTLGDALALMTLDSLAPESEASLIAQNAQDAFRGIVTNGIPKLYLCATKALRTPEDINETCRWINRQIEKNGLDMPLMPDDFTEDDGRLPKIFASQEEFLRDFTRPYVEKLGNCKLVFLPGDHMIYEQKPVECGRIVRDFIDGLDQ